MSIAAALLPRPRSVAELGHRAKIAGRPRPDYELDDLILILAGSNGIRAISPAAAVAASRRYATLAILALEGPAQTMPPPARPVRSS